MPIISQPSFRHIKTLTGTNYWNNIYLNDEHLPPKMRLLTYLSTTIDILATWQELVTSAFTSHDLTSFMNELKDLQSAIPHSYYLPIWPDHYESRFVSVAVDIFITHSTLFDIAAKHNLRILNSTTICHCRLRHDWVDLDPIIRALVTTDHGAEFVFDGPGELTRIQWEPERTQSFYALRDRRRRVIADMPDCRHEVRWGACDRGTVLGGYDGRRVHRKRLRRKSRRN